MKRFGKGPILIACGFFVSLIGDLASAQGLPVDWSHRHLIVSNPETREEAEAKGALDKWIERANDPRFILQMERKERAAAERLRRATRSNPMLESNFAPTSKPAAVKNVKDKQAMPSGTQIHRDWSNVMGGAGGVGGPLVYPAKYAFGISEKDCVNDFVVYTTSTEGADSSGTVLTSVATFSGVPVAGETFEIHNKRFAPDQILTLTAHATQNLGLNFAVGTTASGAATNLANAIARNGGTVGVTATAAGGDVQIASITTDVRGQDINFPNNLSNFRLARDVRGRGTPGQPTIFALNHLYADIPANGGCQTTPTQAVPATYWSYNTSGTTYAGATSIQSFGPSGTTRYGPLSAACSVLASTTATNKDSLAACDTIATRGIVRGFSATTGIVPNNTRVTFTVMKNGAPTSITCTYNHNNSCADTTHQEVFTDDDVISVRIVRTGTGAGTWNTNMALILGPPPVVARTSPVLSLGGEQVAFVQNASGGAVGTDVASLVLLKWSATLPGTVGEPTRPNTVSAATYHAGCIQPCMVVIPFSGATGDSNSSPFVDYSGDSLYVGDDSGNLHKFTGVFAGTPAEQVGGGFPAVVSPGNVLSSPVYDSATGLVFVGSGGESLVANNTQNRLLSVDALSGAVTPGLDIGTTDLRTGVRDAPIVDSTAKRVYAFIGADNSSLDSLGFSCSFPTCAAVYQFATDIPLNFQPPIFKIIVGRSSAQDDANHYIFSGQFDDTYWSSADPTSPSGFLYTCGSLLDADLRPSIWKIQIVDNFMVARTRGPLLVDGNANNGCSPVTIVKNETDGTERLFVGVSDNAAAFGGGGCTGISCVYSYDLPIATSSSITSLPATIGDGTPRYVSISIPSTPVASPSSNGSLVTAVNAGNFGGMIISQLNGVVPLNTPAGTTFTYTLLSDGANTGITCVVVAGQNGCTDTTHSFLTVEGQSLVLKMQRTAGTGTLTNVGIRVQLGSGAAAAIDAAGGSGGIIIDNTVSGGGSQIYYSTRATGTAGTPKGLAVQASQAGLN